MRGRTAAWDSRMTPELAPQLREFVYRYCATLPALEAMILLHSQPDTAWTAELLQRHLTQLSTAGVADLLAAFHWHGFLAAGPDGTYRYQPKSADLRRAAARLAEAYANERVAVTAEVASLEALAPIRSFADAFMIKRDRDG